MARSVKDENIIITCNTNHPQLDKIELRFEKVYQAVKQAGSISYEQLTIPYTPKQVDGTRRRGFILVNGHLRASPKWREKYNLGNLPQQSPSVEESPDTSTEYPLNQILYGPPGTGKTYQTVNYAVAIVEKEDIDEIKEESRKNRKEVKRRFDGYKKDGRIAMVTFHQSFAYEDFIEGIKPVLDNDSSDSTSSDDDSSDSANSDDDSSSEIEYTIEAGVFKRIAQEARNKPDENFVLIIDEINRGNIAKIFGELITLIKDSKRLGKADALTATLPYSKTEFGVPNNLYIIGTMNTADRSIMQLDTALRRRFEFVELMPDPHHKAISTDIQGVNGQTRLKVMNKKIRTLLDREHQIGHTYLMGVEDLEKLKKTFQNNIIPLLQEYFYDGWQKIDAVLNKNGFITSEAPDPELVKSELVDEEQKNYELLPFGDERWESKESYQRIYTTAKQEEQEDQPDTDGGDGE